MSDIGSIQSPTPNRPKSTAIFYFGKINCPNCKKTLPCRPEMIGDVGVCPKCDTDFKIGSPLYPQDKEHETEKFIQKINKVIEPVSKKSLYLLLIPVILKYAGMLLYYTGINTDTLELSRVMWVFFLIAILYLLYRIWSVTYKLGVTRTIPRDIIIALFLPIVNLFWIFKCFWGWSSDYNKTISKIGADTEEHSMPSSLGVLVAFMLIVVGVTNILNIIISEKMSRFYVKRDGNYVQVLHQGEVKSNEALYARSSPSSPFVNRASKDDLISKKQYLFVLMIRFAPPLIFEIVVILFFLCARDCSNYIIGIYESRNKLVSHKEIHKPLFRD